MTGPRTLWLDGVEGEALQSVGSDVRALGSDPFADDPEGDPFLDRLAQLAVEPATVPASETSGGAARPAPPAAADTAAHGARRAPLPPSSLRRTWASTPRLAEVELTDRPGWLDRLLSDDERKRLAALHHLVDGEAPYDRYGFSPGAAHTSFPFFLALYRWYFRVQSEGHEHLPVEGPALLASNHGGLLPFDGAMTVVDVLLHTDPPRLPRAIVDRWAGSLPWVNVFFARVGQVIGTRENFADLLDDGQLVLVYPEGMEGIRKTVTQRYRLQRFHVGFVEEALRGRAPIVPMAVLGSDDQAPILADLKPLARRLGLPVAPITPTFPWLGPLGLLPYPVRYRIVYGEPLCFHERFGPEGADDARLVRYLANQVRRTVQLLIDRNR
jgi:1-acyl-sn-glycerol-3-phosphate acyltransferase